MLWLIVLGLVIFVVHLHSKVNRLEALMLDRWVPAEATAFSGHDPAAAGAPVAEPSLEPDGPPAVAFARAEPVPVQEVPPPEPEVLHSPEEQLSDFPPHWAEPETEAEPSRFSFEELFGRRLPIWAGGITLAIAGMLIVKLSIEAGLVSPLVRVISGMLFGSFLIGGAEFAHRQAERVRDVRVPQALAGAGIASLYASILLATNLYQLIGPVPAMLGMAAITGGAMLLAVRFGAPSALLGLVGGLSAPALIGSSEPNVPLLSLYLALAVGGLCALSRSQRWAWLGVSALVGGFGWGLVLLLGGALDLAGTVSVAIYLLLLAVALPALGLAGDWRDRVQLGAAVVGAAQLAALVAVGGFAMINWALFGMIAAAMVWLGRREPALHMAPGVGLLLGLFLLGAWPDPALGNFALVLAGTALIFGAPALQKLWRGGGLLEAGQIALIAIAVFLLPLLQFEGALPDNSFGLLALGAAVIAAVGASLGWNHIGRREDARFAILSVTAALLLSAATTFLFPDWAVGIGIAAVGLALLELGNFASDRRIEPFAWIIGAAGLAALVVDAIMPNYPTIIDSSRAFIMAVLIAGFAWRGRFKIGRGAAQVLAPVLVFFGFEPMIADRLQPLLPGLGLIALAFWSRRLEQERLLPAMVSTGLILLGWAAMPLSLWVQNGALSLVGLPLFVQAVPMVEPGLTRLLIPAMLLLAAVRMVPAREGDHLRLVPVGAALLLGFVGMHSLYKQLFHIGSLAEFSQLGIAERLGWDMLLIGAAVLLWKLRRPLIALVPLTIAAAHYAAFSLLLHNPLWADQAIGAWPLLNWIVPLYAVAAILLLAVRRHELLRGIVPAPATAVAEMLLILLFAASTLRQLFHGSLLISPGLSQTEDIARSIVAIATAVGFLVWGIRSGRREWRIGSLLLMLCAVGKVFLFDASGLEGLVRIGSFVALGFSLIGIGWLYARYLQAGTPQLANAG